MKKRFLSLFLVLVLLLTGIPAATAAQSGFTSGSTPETSSVGGPVRLPVDTLAASEGSGLTPDKADPEPEAEPKIVQDAAGRFSLTEAANRISATDVVNLIVVMKEAPLLAAGFSADEIAAGTDAVARYEGKQLASLASLKTRLERRFGGSADFKIGFTYTIGTTGISVATQYGNLPAIASMPGVDHVYVAPTFQVPEDQSVETGDLFQPMTSNATKMIGSDVLNQTGYTGKGMKIAVLDTGVVVDHPSFGALPEEKLTESSLTQEGVEAIWDHLNAAKTTLRNQSYYNSKLPFIFNYYWMNFDVSHGAAQHDHGTHVAGIVAANRLESTPVVGVAPDAQLVVMQVFGPTGAGWDTIMAALEDALRLNVDAVNLSLGSAAGFTTSGDDMAEVLDRFAETDIEVLIAAGNDTNNAFQNLTGLSMSKAGNPDIGLAGTPSTYVTPLAIASVDNDGGEQLYFTVDGRKIGYNDTASSPATKFLNNFKGQTLEFVAVPGVGEAADYTDLDVVGKVALVSRGRTSFPEKQAAAQAAGAIACVIYHNAPGVLLMQINDGTGHIPCVSISRLDGEYLADKTAGSLTVCQGDLIPATVERAISEFSSWGVTPDLKLKPEIAGVGGNIYSSRDPDLFGSNYGPMSGTSMATPQVSGAMAVLMQYLRDKYDYEEAELRQVAANLMMSTANPLWYGDLEYSPRAQGAGLVDLVRATTSQGYLSNPHAAEGRPKAELGDDDDRTGAFTLDFEIHNMAADQDLSYTFDASILTETLHEDAYIANMPRALQAEVTVYGSQETDILKYDFNDDGTITTADARTLLRHVHGVQALDETNVHFAYLDVNGDGSTNKADVDLITAYCAEQKVEIDLLEKVRATVEEPLTSVTVPAGETVSLSARIQLTEADKKYLDDSFSNGMYVEGFLYVCSSAEDGVDLQMPFVGFYGNWSDAPVFDEPGEEASLYDRLIFTNTAQLGTNPYLRGGRSGDAYNAFSYANPLAEMDFGMLRNAKKMTFTVTDTATQEVYFDLTGENVVKTYFSNDFGGIIPFYVLTQEGEVWDGMDAQGNKLPDGTKVNYEVKAWLDDGDDVMDDSFSFHVTLDDERPRIVNAYTLQDDVRIENGKVLLPLTLQDNQYIAALIFVNPDGVIMGKYDVNNTPGQAYTAEYNITGFGTDFTIVVGDYACNEFEFDVTLDLGEASDDVLPLKELSKDRLYGCETFDGASIEAGWFSANKTDLSDVRNETYDSAGRYYCGEYVNGYVVAQNANTGDLVLLSPNSTYWGSTTLVKNNGKEGDPGVWVLYDMALDYSGKGKEDWENKNNSLYAVGWMYAGDNDNDGKDDGHNALFKIAFYENGSIFVNELAEITGTKDGGEGLTLGCTTEGQLYMIDTLGHFYSLERDGVATYLGTTDFVHENNYSGVNVIQSMGYDHNTDTMYWFAHSQTASGNSYLNVCMTYTIDLATGACTEVGTYGPGGQTALFVPTDLTSDLFTMGVDPTGFSVSPYSLTMAVGQAKRLTIDWNPWNAAPAAVTWTTSDPAVATVNNYGFVTAIGEGEVEITAKAKLWNQWGGEPDGSGNYPGAWEEQTQLCQLRVVGSNQGIYGFVVVDYNNADNNQAWVTYSDQTPGKVTQIAKQYLKTTNADGETAETLALWQGGAYYNGYVYVVAMEQSLDNQVMRVGTALYRCKITKGETPEQTIIGEPERIGFTGGVEAGNIGFDYNTGRMYCVDYTNGGLGIIDLDTGAIDLLGTYTGDIGGPAITPAMCVTAEGYIVVSDMSGNLYTVDCDTMKTTRIGSIGQDTWYYAGMTYDYDTGNIYWNPCMNAGTSPLYLVRIDPDQWEPNRLQATIMDIGDVSSKNGVEQTAMFTIPTHEPETQQIPVEGIEITNGETAVGLVGGTLQLNTVTTPLRPTSQARTWTSSDEAVVAVDRFGKVTFTGVGTATVTVSITNKDEQTHGGPFTDSISFTVYEAAGDFAAFLGYDEGGTGYYDFWLTVHDNDLRRSTVGESMIGTYSLRSGTYYDGYFYCYDNTGTFYRIDAENHSDYVDLGEVNLDEDDMVVSMAMDYTTGTMYALTLSTYNWSSSTWNYGSLMTVNLDNGQLTEVAKLSAPVSTLAVDHSGVLYAAGSESSSSDAILYTLDPKTAVGTKVRTLEGAYVGTGPLYYYQQMYNAQMTYDFTTDRLYLWASYHSRSSSSGTSGMYMIQLGGGGTPLAVNLGKLCLETRAGSTVKEGNVYLGLLCAIPEADEVPVGTVNGVLLNKSAARVAMGSEITLRAMVRPSNAANQAVTWSSKDPSVAKVDANGVVTGVTAGTTQITVASVEDPSVTAVCSVTVVNVSGPQAMAYTISADREALLSFNPELPSTTVETVTTISGGGKISGLTYGDACLYYTVNTPGFAELYRYDFDTKQSIGMGSLNTLTNILDIAYDAENGLLYAVAGFYVYQFEVDRLEAGQVNSYAGYFLDPSYATLQTIACKGDMVYYLGNNYGNKLYSLDSYLRTRTEIASVAVNTVAGKSEMAYNSLNGLFYVTDAGNRLYSFDETGNVTMIDILGDGLDINGLAIAPPPVTEP